MYIVFRRINEPDVILTPTIKFCFAMTTIMTCLSKLFQLVLLVNFDDDDNEDSTNNAHITDGNDEQQQQLWWPAWVFENYHQLTALCLCHELTGNHFREYLEASQRDCNILCRRVAYLIGDGIPGNRRTIYNPQTRSLDEEVGNEILARASRYPGWLEACAEGSRRSNVVEAPVRPRPVQAPVQPTHVQAPVQPPVQAIVRPIVIPPVQPVENRRHTASSITPRKSPPVVHKRPVTFQIHRKSLKPKKKRTEKGGSSSSNSHLTSSASEAQDRPALVSKVQDLICTDGTNVESASTMNKNKHFNVWN